MEKQNKIPNNGYGRSRLVDDLFAQAEREQNVSANITSRLKWLNNILNYKMSDKTREQIISEFKNEVESAPHFYPFICYLSSNKHFSHSWSYLIERKDEYIESYLNIENFIDSMIDNVNSFMENFTAEEDFSIRVNDLFTFEFDKKRNVFYGTVDWEKCYDMINMKDVCFIKLYHGGNLLFVKRCKISDKENVINDLILWKNDGKQ